MQTFIIDVVVNAQIRKTKKHHHKELNALKDIKFFCNC